MNTARKSKQASAGKPRDGSGNVLCIDSHVICSFPFAAQAEKAAANLRAALKAQGAIAADRLSVRLKEAE